MGTEKFVYVTYIAASQERVWDALVKAELTTRYWDHENVSDWKAGSRWEHRDSGSGDVHIVGRVVESDRPHRLVITWAAPEDEGNAEAHSRVTFTIEAIEDMVKLTVVHDRLEAGSEMLDGIVDGWPRVLSSLKSFLETGRPLKTWAGHKE